GGATASNANQDWQNVKSHPALSKWFARPISPWRLDHYKEAAFPPQHDSATSQKTTMPGSYLRPQACTTRGRLISVFGSRAKAESSATVRSSSSVVERPAETSAGPMCDSVIGASCFPSPC